MVPGPDVVIACPRCGALHRRWSLASGNTFGAVLWSDGWFEAPMCPLPPWIARCVGCRVFFWVKRAVELGEMDHYTSQCDETLTTLTLESTGTRRVEVMRQLRARLGLGLQAVRHLVDHLPARVGEYVRPSDARDVVAALGQLGAHVSSTCVVTQPYVQTNPQEWSEAPQVEYVTEALFLEAIREGLATTPDEERELRQWAWWVGNKDYRRGAPWVPLSQRAPEVRENAAALMALCSTHDAEQRLMHAELLRESERFEEARALLDLPPPLATSPGLDVLRDAVRRGESRLLPLPRPEAV
ncbi:ribosomal protein L7/L12 [Myxococcus sp. K15C18031901]|uniref:ribosomal protein L7/L12 n=1 Tax=Myxococcus dinghuensis TaxID=2906761 RepID=UPI0020A6E25F|nr:ribosomal protein L7/L12 [Myxococcus dinghuensis]MCP3100609.1 ribosomal protein L7/L12 [Myxococcus dinghuensis]